MPVLWWFWWFWWLSPDPGVLYLILVIPMRIDDSDEDWWFWRFWWGLVMMRSDVGLMSLTRTGGSDESDESRTGELNPILMRSDELNRFVEAWWGLMRSEEVWWGLMRSDESDESGTQSKPSGLVHVASLPKIRYHLRKTGWNAEDEEGGDEEGWNDEDEEGWN
jgi:hypothetical protein